eukprot:6203833-Pleurochrysis_carterae.AAC.7
MKQAKGISSLLVLAAAWSARQRLQASNVRAVTCGRAPTARSSTPSQHTLKPAHLGPCTSALKSSL